MNEKSNRKIFLFKLLVAFICGFILWKYAVLSLDWLIQGYDIDSLWTVVLSRFALLGYLLPFVIWFLYSPNKPYHFRFGDTRATIKMPCVWYGVKDNVLRVSVVFSALCLVLAVVLFYAKKIDITIMVAGLAFALVNSVLEELLWRGFILSRTIELCGEKLGLVVMSLAFGLYHYPLGFSLPICLVFSLGGIYFGGIAIGSKGLLLGTIMHMSMNVLFVTLGIIF